MNDKTIAELREFYKSAVFNCWLNKRGADVLGDILSRAETAKDEPLAVLADRKGCYVRSIKHYPDAKAWAFYIQENNIWMSSRNYGVEYMGETYEDAEKASRAYLEGLKDVKGGR